MVMIITVNLINDYDIQEAARLHAETMVIMRNGGVVPHPPPAAPRWTPSPLSNSNGFFLT
jgi:hypothetical protein